MYVQLMTLAMLLLPACVVTAHPGEHEQLANVERQLERSPTDQSLHIRRGMAHANMAQYEEALADYAQAAELGPPILVAFERAVVYYRMGELERAAQYLTEYQQAFPDNPVAYEYQARIARDRGDFPAAVAYLQAFIDRHRQPNPGHYLTAATMLAQMQKPDEALALLDAGMERLGQVPQLQRYAIALEMEQQRPQAALQRMDAMSETLQRSPRWQMEKVELLLQAGQPGEARTMMDALSTALGKARPTPANQALQQRLVSLRAAAAQ
tara:strand:- start:176514 stop:177317 length:804 start_codon:yes stop_codon:yes gene_type:complete